MYLGTQKPPGGLIAFSEVCILFLAECIHNGIGNGKRIVNVNKYGVWWVTIGMYKHQ